MHQNMKNKLHLLYTMIMVIACAACSSNETNKHVEVIKVCTETAQESNYSKGESYVGTVEADVAVAVSFTGMGTIKQVHVSEGARVRKGQLLAEMDKTQAENALATATATHKQATDAYNRMKQLYESKSLADIKWVEVQSKVEQAEATLAAAKKMLEDCYIYSPIDGIVGKKMLHAGETALPSQPVVTVLSINKLKVKVSIPEKEIAKVNPDTESSITIEALGGRSIDGGKIEKGVTADATTHTYDIRINIDNAMADILPGMVAKVTLLHQDSLNGIYMPIRAVQRGADGKNFVWCAVDGKAQRCNVSVGKTYGDRIEIVSGLAQGEKVITSGYQKVSEGMSINAEQKCIYIN